MRIILRLVRALVKVQPAIVRDGVYSRSQLDEIFGKNDLRFAKWRKAGLRPLGTETQEKWFSGQELIEAWTRIRDKEDEEDIK